MYRFRLEHAKYCNCAGCQCELLGGSQREQVELAIEMGQVISTPLVACRIRDGERNAPYCEGCLDLLAAAYGLRMARRAPGQAAKLRITNS